tara:strand:- start:214 stop:558 length:345 start_codon:yes stop_codon:yes gene_type:complete
MSCTVLLRAAGTTISPDMSSSDTVRTRGLEQGGTVSQRVSPTQDIIAVFQGAQAYISPYRYPSKAESHAQVPTWHYEVVHVHGRMTFQQDERSKIAAVGRLTKIFETKTNGVDA